MNLDFLGMFGTSAYWGPTTIGLFGLALWILATWADPTDDTVSGTVTKAFGKHSRTLTVAVLSHLALCAIWLEMQQLTVVAAVTSGYASQSLLTKGMDAYTKKMNGGTHP